MKVLGFILIGVLALIGAATLLALLWLRWKLGRQFREQMARSRAEQQVKEEAEWFGTTGLNEETERELPRYLRREFGESLFDEGSLKAAALKYVGVFSENEAKTHYWNIPYGKDDRVFAYVEVSKDGSTCTGWGSKEPPEQPGFDD